MNKKILVILSALILAVSLCSLCVSAADGQTVYVADGGIGDGTSAASPLGSMSAALKAVGTNGGEIVVCGAVKVSGTLTIPETSGDLTIRATDGGSLTVAASIYLTKNTNDNVVTLDLPVTFSGSVTHYIYGNYNSVTFGKNFEAITTGNYAVNFYGGYLNGATDGITTLPYDIVVENGTFDVFAGGNYRATISDNVGSIAAPISITINGGTFGKEGTYSTDSNNKNYDTFSVSGMSILADDATLTITGGTFHAPIYVQGGIGVVMSQASEKSKTTASDKKYYAIDGDITVNISGGTFGGGAVGAYYTQAAYTQVMRGNYTVNISGSPEFTVKTLFDATQVKAYAGKSEKASITYPKTLKNIEVKRFDVVNGAKKTYEEPLRVAFIGDSITEGYAVDAAGVDRLTQSYPANFLKYAEADGREVIVSNYGISAAGLTKSLTRYYNNMLAWPMVSEETDADYVFFALGTNDGSAAGGTSGALLQFETNLTEMVKQMGDLPSTEKVFVTNAIYRNTSNVVSDIRVSAVIHPIQQRVAEKLAAAEPNKYTFVDLYGLTLSAAADESLFRDNNGKINERLHPTQTGLALMGKSCYEAAFGGVTKPATDYKRTDIYVSARGTIFGAGTKEDPCSSLPVAFDKIPMGSEVTIHIVGTVALNGNLFFPLTASKITVVGEGTGATLICGGDAFKSGTDIKFDNITLQSGKSSGTAIMACFNDFELTETVKTVGTWSFYAGHNVFADVDPATASAFDTPESVSSANDCTIILNGGTFVNFLLGNRRFTGGAPFGTYSGNMTAVIGKNVSFTGTPQYRAINGHNYVTGTVNVTVNSWVAGQTPAEFCPTGSMANGITYNAANNTGKTTIIMGDPVAASVELKMTLGKTTYTLNGATKTMDVAPIIRNERTMLPVRYVAEALGAEIAWDGATSTATLKTADTEIKITVGAASATVNGKSVALDSPAFIENDRTYMPVRFVAETLGGTVAWDGATSTATITK